MLSKFLKDPHKIVKYKLNISQLFRRSMSSTNTIIVKKFDHITTIGINRPEKRNCINKSTAVLLAETIKKFEEDNNAYVGVLHGIGGNFCAGYDLSEISELGDYGADDLLETGPMGLPQRVVKKPLVAALSGFAVAGGLELALLCDLRVIEENAVLGVYNRRFGIPLINGGTVRLQATVGLSRTLDLILTGRSIDAKEAYEWGLANRIVACGTALGQAMQLAGSLVKFPQDCLLQDRHSVYNAAFNSSYQTLLKYEQEHGRKVFNSESVAGAKKFMSGIGKHGKSYNLTEKELPEWEKQ